MNLNTEAIAERLAEFEARADAENLSPMKRDLMMRKIVWGQHFSGNDLLLDSGRDYAVGPNTYAGRRGTPKQCYMNATHLAHDNPDTMTYVEGKITIHGVPIDHAWCVDADGVVVDPTIVPDADGTAKRVADYYGVPFKAEYLRKATVWNKVYGLLSPWSAPKTAPKLYELGLEAGQRWLLDQPLSPPRKPRKKKAAR